ncbi:uncharacterized protein involved in exopolysaccharide biosynthesis [Microvirga lupini]|uniref:Uncharacterized protein involved in exopolysaccharide biosynthesis n=1 Tax=Microvirga lupini TaxID=420324 RepID=A0A7W4YZW3_9HYPH|nr:Wzz/FepE/Etk N-terminal domain-containing protein [Microvirga lupini]MBB3021694.1 uncharacterized protein involved in exopolysaccharide biosynthesis [Microvirga lupini]
MNKHWTTIDSTFNRPTVPTSSSMWTFLFRRKKTILGMFASLFLAATALLYLIPPAYEAEASLLVERNRSPIMRADILPGLEMAEVMNTARGIASSRTVITAVVDSLQLPERPHKQSLMSAIRKGANQVLVAFGLLPEINERDAWILSLMKLATVKPVVNSNILTISLALDDPELASEIVNEISVQYVKQHLKIYSTKGLAEFYRDSMNAAEASYRTTRENVIAFKTNASLFAVSATREEYTRELGTLRSQLLTASNDLSRLLRRYDQQHPEVTVVNSVISAVESRIADTEDKLKKLEENEATLADLEMVLESKRKTYLEFVNKYGEAAINGQADSNVVNVRVVEQASVPPQPWMPRLYLLLGAAILSALLAIAAAFVREFFDSRPTSSDEVERVLRVPVVGWLEDLPQDDLHALWSGEGR